jgi:hypothetical protein
MARLTVWPCLGCGHLRIKGRMAPSRCYPCARPLGVGEHSLKDEGANVDDNERRHLSRAAAALTFIIARLHSRAAAIRSTPVSGSAAKYKSVTGRNIAHNLAARSRRALAMTETELSDIASAATTGLSRIPNVG